MTARLSLDLHLQRFSLPSERDGPTTASRMSQEVEGGHVLSTVLSSVPEPDMASWPTTALGLKSRSFKILDWLPLTRHYIPSQFFESGFFFFFFTFIWRWFYRSLCLVWMPPWCYQTTLKSLESLRPFRWELFTMHLSEFGLKILTDQVPWNNRLPKTVII